MNQQAERLLQLRHQAQHYPGKDLPERADHDSVSMDITMAKLAFSALELELRVRNATWVSDAHKTLICTHAIERFLRIMHSTTFFHDVSGIELNEHEAMLPDGNIIEIAALPEHTRILTMEEIGILFQQ